MSAATLIREFSKKYSGTIAEARRAEKDMKKTSNQTIINAIFLHLMEDDRMDDDLGWVSSLTVKVFD